jgi:hypothetical protein
MRSFSSTRLEALDALDDLDVVTGVVTIRDQGCVAQRFSRVTRARERQSLDSGFGAPELAKADLPPFRVASG